MRSLMLIPLLALMMGCVTYYYPGLETPETVYYSTNDTVYDDYGGAVVTHDYTTSRYYPWWSMDYFYLGSGHYHSGFSVGFSTRYSPWNRHYGYPYHSYYYPATFYDPWFYSSWYAPIHYHYNYYDYGYSYAYYNPFWQHRYREYHRRHHDDDRYDDRYGNQRHPRNQRPNDQGYDTSLAENRERNRGDGRVEPGPVTRRVSVAPGSAAADRGMVVRSRENRKPTRDRTEPVNPKVIAAGSPASPATGSRAVREPGSDYTVARRGNEQVRYRPESKQGRSRTAPVSPGDRVTSGSPQLPTTSQRATRAVSNAQRGGMTVRSPSQAKTGKSRVQPSTGAPIQMPRAVRATPPQRTAPVQRSTRVQPQAPARHSAPVQRSARVQPQAPARSTYKAPPAPRASAPPEARPAATRPSRNKVRDRD